MNLDWGNLLTLGHLVNLLDILVVWFVIYELIVMLRGTKAIQLFRGVILILIVRFISAYLGLNTVSWLVDQVINWSVIAIIIVFQPEIRRGLEHLGRGSLFVRVRHENEAANKVIDGLDKAIQYMSKRRIGALMTIQRDTGLEDYIETGIDLDAELTGELLILSLIHI